MQRPLQTGGGTVASVPLVLIDLECDREVIGRSYIFAYSPLLLPALGRLITTLGDDLTGAALHPLDLFQALRKRFLLAGNQGLVAMACGGIDMALWDAHARAQDLPLFACLGGQAREIPAYNSNGLGLMAVASLAQEARELAAPGFSAVKLRLGHTSVEQDRAAVLAVSEALACGVKLMCDYNQCLRPAEAIQRLRVLDELGLYWLEEPTLAADYAGNAAIRARVGTALQLGENCWGALEMKAVIDSGACDYFMADAMKIGGVSGWLQAGALADSAAIPLSSHLYPEFSAHLLSISPSAHWLEYVDWAQPVLRAPLVPTAGVITPPATPGAGLEWNAEAISRYQVAI